MDLASGLPIFNYVCSNLLLNLTNFSFQLLYLLIPEFLFDLFLIISISLFAIWAEQCPHLPKMSMSLSMKSVTMLPYMAKDTLEV